MDTSLKAIEFPKPTKGYVYVYILLCSNESLYVGQSHDLRQRFEMHSSGTGAMHTAKHKPVKLVHVEGPMELEEAVKRERQLKKWSNAKKMALAKGNIRKLRRLSRSRG